MHGAIVGTLVGALIYASGAAAEGYPQHPQGGRNIMWPPQGGVNQFYPLPPPWEFSPQAQDPDFAGYDDAPDASSYRRGYGYWQGNRAGYPRQGPAWLPPWRPMPLPAQMVKPLERGHPVEVVPPPGIPVDEVKQAISDKPKREWRPVPDGEGRMLPPGPVTPVPGKPVMRQAGSPRASYRQRMEGMPGAMRDPVGSSGGSPIAAPSPEAGIPPEAPAQ